MKSLGLLLLRMTVGSLIAIHGYPKLFGGPNKKVSPEVERFLGPGFTQSLQRGGLQGHANMVQNLDIPAPQAMATVSAATEFFGGLALILGWHTRLASLLLMGNMGVAIQKVHQKNGLLGQGGFENPLLFLLSFATLFLAGPGAISIDRA